MRKLYDSHADYGIPTLWVLPRCGSEGSRSSRSCKLRALKIPKVGGRALSPSQSLTLPFEKRLAVTHQPTLCLEPKWLRCLQCC
jgi:hypothetical protein